MNRVELILVLYIFFIGFYLISAVDSVFWNCVYFSCVDAVIIFFLIQQLKTPVSKSLIWGTIAIVAEHAFIISSLTARDYISYYDTLTNRNIALLLILTIIIVFIVVSFIEHRKWKKYGNC
jgi:hypothetical protein